MEEEAIETADGWPFLDMNNEIQRDYMVMSNMGVRKRTCVVEKTMLTGRDLQREKFDFTIRFYAFRAC